MGNQRLHLFERSRNGKHGLNHELAALKAMVHESLAMQRILVLDKPRLDPQHSFSAPFQRTEWTDYVNFNKSFFSLRAPDNRLLCQGILSDCVSSTFNHAFLSQGRASDVARLGSEDQGDRNSKAPIVVRDIGTSPKQLSEMKWYAYWSNFSLSVSFGTPVNVLNVAAEIVYNLRVASPDGFVTMVHARRGDKVVRCNGAAADIWCNHAMVDGLDKATSTENIVQVLNQVAPHGSVVYIATNEWADHFFDSVRRAGYQVYQWKHIVEVCSPN